MRALVAILIVLLIDIHEGEIKKAACQIQQHTVEEGIETRHLSKSQWGVIFDLLFDSVFAHVYTHVILGFFLIKNIVQITPSKLFCGTLKFFLKNHIFYPLTSTNN